MDKKTFIRELEQSLSVLQEDELRDIVGEYEQHIDMKVQRGLTEEEAIADFGSLPELTAEVLEAYHVRADYAAAPGAKKAKKEKKFSFAEKEKAEEMLQHTGEACAKTGKKTLRGLKLIGAWLWGVILFWKEQIARPFAWAGKTWSQHQKRRAAERDMIELMEMQSMPENAQPAWQEEDMDMVLIQPERQGTQEMQGTPVRSQVESGAPAGYARTVRGRKGIRPRRRGILRNMAAALIKIVSGTCRFCWDMACWGMRMVWNFCWVLFSLFCGAMGLFCLFGLGVLIVLMTQGYPLAGVTVGLLGLNLCLFASAGFGMTLIIWKKRNKDVISEESGRERAAEEKAGRGNVERHWRTSKVQGSIIPSGIKTPQEVPTPQEVITPHKVIAQQEAINLQGTINPKETINSQETVNSRKSINPRGAAVQPGAAAEYEEMEDGEDA